MSLIDAALAIALANSAAEESTRVDVVGTPVEQIAEAMRAELAPKFQAIWDAVDERKYMRMARRVGKSHHCIREQAVATARGNAASMNPYILPTHKSARLVIWPLMKKIVKRHFPEAVINETLTTIALPVGGTMICGGCETMADVGRWYGMAFEMAVVDERGNFPDAVLTELDDEALEPSLMDFGGRFIGAGNPGRTLRGRWYDQSKDGRRDDPTPLYIGDARENPFLGKPAAAYFESVKKRHGWTDASPTFRRQYLGEWVEDSDGLVFPLTAGNFYEGGLPTKSLAGGALPPHLWRYVIGVDIGYVDATAFVVLAAHPMDNREFMVSAEKYTEWLPRQVGQRLTDLRKQYPGAPIVMDTGSAGKPHAEECNRIFGLGVIPAEKSHKASAIRVLRDDIRSHRFQVPAGDSCKVFTEQCAIIGWDDDGEKPEEGLPDDVVHAAYYAHRWQHHYGNRMAEPVDDSADALAKRQEAEWLAKRLAQTQRNRGSFDSARTSWGRR
jgi:hypothetical protein